MPSNLEIKARLRDLPAAQRAAEAVSDVPRQVLRQEDTFFRVAAGRLKLRQLSPERGELIYYQRPDAAGPKVSDYLIAPTSQPGALKAALAAALGVRGTVRKERWLYLAGRTRIHLDQVEGLGAFLELEVVLGDGEAAEQGQADAARLMDALGVAPGDLIDAAYIDLLERGAGGLAIRPFQPADQAAAKRLILAGLEEHWGALDLSLNPDLDDIAASYAGGLFLTAWDGDELAGTGALVRESADAARVVRMSVASRRRRSGIGRAILEQLRQAAVAQGYRRIVLETTATWHDAVAFYIRNGFTPERVSEGDIHFTQELNAHPT
jgi:adenylate cyclase class IV/GNAT superfamily N-acetyltransferase